MFLRFIRDAEYSSSQFILINVQNILTHCRNLSQRIYPSTADGSLGYYEYSCTCPVHVPTHTYAHSQAQNDCIIGSMFNLLAVSRSARTNLHSYQQSVRVSTVPHSHQHIIAFLNFSHSSGCAEVSHCGLTFFSRRTNEVSQLSYICCTFQTLLRSVCLSLLSTFSTGLAVFFLY